MEPTKGLEPLTCCLQKPCGPLPPRPGRCHPLPGAAVLPARTPKPAGLTPRLLPSDVGACRRGGGSDGGRDSGTGLAGRTVVAARPASQRRPAGRPAPARPAPRARGWCRPPPPARARARRRTSTLARAGPALRSGAAGGVRRRPAPPAITRGSPARATPAGRAWRCAAPATAAATHRRARGGPPRRDAPVPPGLPGYEVRA